MGKGRLEDKRVTEEGKGIQGKLKRGRKKQKKDGRRFTDGLGVEPMKK